MYREQRTEELIHEFSKWASLEDKNDSILVRCKESDKWRIQSYSVWDANGCVYIVNDKYAEYKKAFYNKKKIQKRIMDTDYWVTVESILEIEGDYEFRITALEWYEDPKNINKIVLARDEDDEEWMVDIFERYRNNAQYSFSCKNSLYKQAKLTTINELIELGYLDTAESYKLEEMKKTKINRR